MSKAEERALEIYPIGPIENHPIYTRKEVRKFIEKGYKQAEKDLDIESIKREWYNKGYLEGRKNAHIPAKELGLSKSCDFQAEKDLALTWEDILEIFRIADAMEEEPKKPTYLSPKYCAEILRRFLESKNK